MNKCLKYTCFHGPGTNVIESNTSNRLQSNSNSLKILNCNSNRLQSNSNRLLVIDPIPAVWGKNHIGKLITLK